MPTISINFRSTTGVITDGGGEVASTGETYPTTIGGYSMGWSASGVSWLTRDRGGSDPHFYGIGGVSNGPIPATFKISGLPTSSPISVRAAFGDNGNESANYVNLKDGSTVVASLPGTIIPGSQCVDMTNATLAFASWSGSNTAVTATFASGVVSLEMGGQGGPDGSYLQHLELSWTVASTPSYALGDDLIF